MHFPHSKDLLAKQAWRTISAAFVIGVQLLGCAGPPIQCEDKPTRAALWRANCRAVGTGLVPAPVVAAAHSPGPADMPSIPGDSRGGTREPVCVTQLGRCVARFDRAVPLGTACYCTAAGQRVPGVTASGWNP